MTDPVNHPPHLLEQMARNIPQWLEEIKRRVAERFEANRRKAA